MSRNRNLTIREGTSEKNWYFLAGYVALGIITVLLTITTIVQGGSYSIGAMIGLLIMAISVLGLGTYLALFKDAAYIRDTRSRWGPKWWYYIGGGFGTPFAVYFVATALPQLSGFAGVVALVAHALSASVMSGVYLYRRHQHIGVP